MHEIWLLASASNFILFVSLHVGFCRNLVMVVTTIRSHLVLFLEMKTLV